MCTASAARETSHQRRVPSVRRRRAATREAAALAGSSADLPVELSDEEDEAARPVRAPEETAWSSAPRQQGGHARSWAARREKMRSIWSRPRTRRSKINDIDE